MTKSLEALIADMKHVSHEESAYRDSSDSSDRWYEVITPENVLTVIAALEQTKQKLNAANELIAKIQTNSCHVDTAKDAVIPKSLDAWGRQVPQYLPYNFSAEESVSTRQYANGWNDAGGYWLNYVTYLQGCIRAAGAIVEGGE